MLCALFLTVPFIIRFQPLYSSAFFLKCFLSYSFSHFNNRSFFFKYCFICSLGHRIFGLLLTVSFFITQCQPLYSPAFFLRRFLSYIFTNYSLTFLPDNYSHYPFQVSSKVAFQYIVQPLCSLLVMQF